MSFLKSLLLIVHMLTLAGILLLCMVNFVLNRPLPKGLWHMVLTMAVSGLAMVGLKLGLDEPVNHVKLAIKFGVVLVMVWLVYTNSKREQLARGFYPAIFLLAILNIGIAYGWG